MCTVSGVDIKLPRTHGHVDVHTRGCSCSRARTFKRILVRTPTTTHARERAHTPYRLALTLTLMLTLTLTLTLTLILTHIPTLALAYAHARAHARTHTHTHARIRTHIHAGTHFVLDNLKLFSLLVRKSHDVVGSTLDPENRLIVSAADAWSHRKMRSFVARAEASTSAVT
jgi:hypothetical protein